MPGHVELLRGSGGRLGGETEAFDVCRARIEYALMDTTIAMLLKTA